MLSLSPRYDLFRFQFPKDFLPPEVEEKWKAVLSREAGVIVDPIEYLNESIKAISIPGISDVNITQMQHSYNPNPRDAHRINIEPNQNNTYVSSANPLDKINRELKVTFRTNNGFYNYFMLFESLFYRICKHHLYGKGEDYYIYLLDEEGNAQSRIIFYQCHMDGIEGLDMSYDKVERQTDTFDVTFKWNNIDYEFIETKRDQSIFYKDIKNG